MFKILVVEDDRELNRAVCAFLGRNGYEAVGCLCAEEAYDALYETVFDLIISDIMMPGTDGFEFARTVREQNTELPILFMTARDDLTAKQRGFSAGADDYMTKPFSMRELIARCKALLRRVDRAKVIAKNSENEKLLDFGSLVIDPAQRIVTVNGEQVHLTPTEFDLLATLARKPKSVLTREKLLEEVWDWVDASGTRTVDSHVKALRHKLGSKTIRTVHGVGYAFEPPEE